MNIELMHVQFLDSKVTALTSLTLSLGFHQRSLILCRILRFVLRIFGSSFAIYNFCLVSVAGSQLGGNALIALALTLAPIPKRQ